MVKDNIFNFVLGHNRVLYKAIKITSFEAQHVEIGANGQRYGSVADA